MRLCSVAALALIGCVPDPDINVPDFSPTGPQPDLASQPDMAMPVMGWTTGKSGSTANLRAVWASDANLTTIYVAGSGGTLLRGSPSSLLTEASGVTDDLYAVLGVSADEAYAVGANGTILHRTAGKWAQEAKGMTPASLFGLAAPAAGEVFAVGDNGVVLHRGGAGAWQVEIGGGKENLRAIWGKSLTEVWAVGEGVVWRRDADKGTWALDTAKIDAADLGNYYAITGVSGTPFMAGEYGRVLRRTTDKWVAEATIKPAAGPPPHFYGLYGWSTSLLVVGKGGAVQRRSVAMDVATWTEEKSGTTSDLSAIAGGGGMGAVATGAGGVLLRRN